MTALLTRLRQMSQPGVRIPSNRITASPETRTVFAEAQERLATRTVLAEAQERLATRRVFAEAQERLATRREIEGLQAWYRSSQV